MIKNTDMEFSNGVMVKYMKDIGKTENKMGKVNLINFNNIY